MGAIGYSIASDGAPTELERYGVRELPILRSDGAQSQKLSTQSTKATKGTEVLGLDVAFRSAETQIKQFVFLEPLVFRSF